MTAQHYDLVVIGCGPAGEKAAAQAAYFGKRCAIVDRAQVGGACVHTGTLPSKALRESALHLSGLNALGVSGVACTVAEGVSVNSLMAHREAVAEAEVNRIISNLERHGIDLLQGAASLIAEDKVRIEPLVGEPTELTADVIVIATGTRPRRPDGLPFETGEVWDSDQVLDMESLPHSMIVYGAGVIGCEYAAMFAALGVDITLLEPRDAILPFVDHEVTESLLRAFRTMGMEIGTEATIEGVRGEPGVGVKLLLRDGRKFEADRLLFCAGRTPNSDGLGLDGLGIEVNRRGQIVVDGNYHTGVGNIYAVGDIIGFPALASTGMEQGRVAVCNAFNFSYKDQVSVLLPYGIYTIPECAMVGLTERDCQSKEIDYEIGTAHYEANARGQLGGRPQGLLKLVFSPADKKLLGVHVVGDQASELVHTGMTVMQFGGTIDAFIEAVYNFPTLSELYKYAAYDGLGRLQRRNG
jgi:NAD(P) transhydrogenase